MGSSTCAHERLLKDKISLWEYYSTGISSLLVAHAHHKIENAVVIENTQRITFFL